VETKIIELAADLALDVGHVDIGDINSIETLWDLQHLEWEKSSQEWLCSNCDRMLYSNFFWTSEGV
jgi:hypothetical protein